MALQSYVVVGVASVSIGVAVTAEVSFNRFPVVVCCDWVEEADSVTWGVRVPPVSISVDDVSF